MIQHDTILSSSLNKRSIQGRGSVVRGLDSGHGANICARELASVVSRGLQ